MADAKLAKWKLVLFENDGACATRTIKFGSLDECIEHAAERVSSTGLDWMGDSARLDLSRIGARYHEYVGGTLVVVPIEGRL